MKLHVRWAGAALAACASVVLPAAAQSYPHHPVKIVSPYPPGGTTDILARMLSPKLSAAPGQPVIGVEQRSGVDAGSWGGILSQGAKARGVAGEIARVLEAAQFIADREAAMAQAIRAGHPITEVMGANHEHLLRK